MRILTSRPIIEQKSNCCGMSNFDDYSNGSGLVDKIADKIAESEGGDSSVSSDDSVPINEGKSNKDLVKDYLSKQKDARKSATNKALGDTLLGSESRRDTRRGGREVSRASRLQNKDTRVSERIANRQARAKRRTDRKAKRNAKKLILVKTPRSADPKFFFPLQKLRLSKKKKGKYEKTYADGTTSEVDRTMVVTDPNTGAVYDKKEISNATGVPLETVTPQTIKSVETTTTVDPNTNQPTLAIEVNDNLVSGAQDGNAYLNSDIQGSQEKDENVADDDKKKEGEKQPMTKTTKIIIGVAVTAVVGLIVYAVVKGRSAVPKI
jgi:hypothetical protein